MQFIEYRLPESRGTTADYATDNSTNGITLFSHTHNKFFHTGSHLLIRTSDGIILCLRKIELGIMAIQRDFSNPAYIDRKSVV
jgi:hypothetical protein